MAGAVTSTASAARNALPHPSPLNQRALSIAKLVLLLTTFVAHAIAAPLNSISQSLYHGSDGHSSGDVFTTLGHGGSEDPPVSRTGFELTMDLLSIAGLVILGGIFAGLTLALMGLDELHLQVLSSSGSDLERARASKVLRLLARGKHWVLVVLLLGNVIVNETLPIFLSEFGGGLPAVITSTALIVIFGEIVPQSICARYGLAIGAFCAPLVHATMILFAPIAWPTAKLLDWCLGEDHGTTYRKAELKTFVSLHHTLGAENLSEDEVTIIRAVLDLNEKTLKDVMTPINDVYTLSADEILDEAGVGKLVNSGYSRVPVHEAGKPDAILGMLLVKRLIQYDPEDAMPVSWFNLTPLPEASPDLTLLDCLNYFQQGRSHMLLVSAHPGEQKGALGVVTLEDVIEEMIGEEIIDETDVFQDNHYKVKVERKPGSQENWGPLIKGIIERRRKPGSERRQSSRAPLRSSYGVPKSRVAARDKGTPGSSRAMDKVSIKRPGSPTISEGGYPSRGNNAGSTAEDLQRRAMRQSADDPGSRAESPTPVVTAGMMRSFSATRVPTNASRPSTPKLRGGNDLPRTETMNSITEEEQYSRTASSSTFNEEEFEREGLLAQSPDQQERYWNAKKQLQEKQRQYPGQPFIVEMGHGDGRSGPTILTSQEIPEEPGAEERARRRAEEEERKQKLGETEDEESQRGRKGGQNGSSNGEPRRPLLDGVKKLFGGSGSGDGKGGPSK